MVLESLHYFIPGTVVFTTTCFSIADPVLPPIDADNAIDMHGCFDKGAFICLLIFGIGVSLMVISFAVWQCALDITKQRAEEAAYLTGSYEGI